MDENKIQLLKETARDLRRKVLQMIYAAKTSHIGSAFSIIEILLYLYEEVLRINPANPLDPLRDRLVLSKGWAASALYVVLARKKFFPEELLNTYCADGSPLVGITTLSTVPGIEATTGSMGHGLPIAVGMALASEKKQTPYRVFAIISDGELNEGSTWEAIFFAGFHKLHNLILIIDYNKLQLFGRVADVLDPEPLGEKFKAFRWSVFEINGHDFNEMSEVFTKFSYQSGKPCAVIAHTIKGKGVTFMEDNGKWHYLSPTTEQFEAAKQELS